MLSLEELTSIIDDLGRRFWVQTGPDSEHTLRQRVLNRRAHFDGREQTAFTGRLKGMTPFVSDLPRQKWAEGRARITENHFVVRVEPIKDTASQRNAANEVEAGLNAGLMLVEERNGYRLQEAMADAQYVDGVGVLHWRRADHLYPEYPEAEQIVELPADEDEKKRYSSRRKNGYYAETPDSVRERRKRDCAKAGFPWIIEVPDILACAWDEDDFGISTFVYIKDTPVLRYLRMMQQDSEDMDISPVEGGGEPIYRSRPMIPELSNVQTSDRVTVATVWTRDHWYELFSPVASTSHFQSGMAWTLRDHGEHEAEEPPFALFYAQRLLNRPPEDAFIPALEGTFRLKAQYDRAMSLMMALQEQSAIKMYYLARIGTGEPMLGEDGQEIHLTSDAATSFKVPDGYEIRELSASVEPGFVNSVGAIRQEYMESVPKTGRTEIGSSSSPWTVRLGLEMENVEPRALINQQLRAFQKMVRNMCKQISKRTEPDYVFARLSNGKVDRSKVVAIEPKLIESLDVNVDIDPVSQAERVALIEQGKGLLDASLITNPDFYGNYMKVQNPDRMYAQVVAFTHFKNNVQELLLKQEMARILAPLVALGTNGQFIGPGGQALSPEQVIAQNGGQPMPGPNGYGGGAPPPPQPMGGVQGGGAMAPTMPQLPPLETPGTLTMPGMPR